MQGFYRHKLENPTQTCYGDAMPQNRSALSRRATFWSAASVLALCLWASAAASVLYPSYEAKWNLPSVVVTSVFGTYPVALLLVLLVFGGVSDYVGRRRAMLFGIALIALSAVLFALAPNVGWLFAARVLQGFGTGFAIGAASARLVENNISANPRFASSMTTASTATGLTLALLLSGILAQLAPLPLVLSFVLLFVLAVVAFVFVALTPDDRPASTGQALAPPGAPPRARHDPTVHRGDTVGLRRLLGRRTVSLARVIHGPPAHAHVEPGRDRGDARAVVLRDRRHRAADPEGARAPGRHRGQRGVDRRSRRDGGDRVIRIARAAAALGRGGRCRVFARLHGWSLTARSHHPERAPRRDPVAALPVLLPAAGGHRDRSRRAGDSARAGPAIGVIAPIVGLLCLAAIVLAAVDFAGRRRVAPVAV